MNVFYVYIFETTSKDGKKRFYTGYTKDLLRRGKEHRNGKGAKFFRGKKRPELKYFETVNSYLLFGFSVKSNTEFKNFILCDLADKRTVADTLNTTEYITGGTGSYDPEYDKQRMWFLVPNNFEFSNYVVKISGKNNE